MADCEYCGKPAGVFRSIHRACEQRRDQARADLNTVFERLMVVERAPAPTTFRAIVEKLGADAQLDSAALRGKVISGLATALDTALADFDLSHNEVARLQGIIDAFDLDDASFDEAGIRERLVKALVLKDLSEGKASTSVSLLKAQPVPLKRDELVQWLFTGVIFNEPRTRTSYVGGSHGVSIRLMKGVSYRVGAHKGQRMQRTEIVTVGTGNLMVTTSAVYFLNAGNSKRTPLSGVVAVNAYEDGIVVAPSRGKSQIYLLSDPMFAANLILKAAAL